MPVFYLPDFNNLRAQAQHCGCKVFAICSPIVHFAHEVKALGIKMGAPIFQLRDKSCRLWIELISVLAAQDSTRKWKMCQATLSSRYSTRISEVATVYAK